MQSTILVLMGENLDSGLNINEKVRKRTNKESKVPEAVNGLISINCRTDYNILLDRSREISNWS